MQNYKALKLLKVGDDNVHLPDRFVISSAKQLTSPAGYSIHSKVFKNEDVMVVSNVRPKVSDLPESDSALYLHDVDMITGVLSKSMVSCICHFDT